MTQPRREKMSEKHQRMTIIFNEWAKRYSNNPELFTDILDEDGNPVSDYGECCAIYFTELEDELF